MKQFLLFSLVLAIFAPSLVQAMVVNAHPGVKAAVHYHDHSSHDKQNKSGGSNGDVYVTSSGILFATPDPTIEQIDFSSTVSFLPIYSIALSFPEARAPPGRPGPGRNDYSAIIVRQPSLILTTHRFRI